MMLGSVSNAATGTGAITTDRSVLNEKAAALEIATRNLAAAEAHLNARVKAFQDKVAQITA